MVGLDFSCRIIFCSATWNFRARSLILGSFGFLVTMVKLVSSPVGAVLQAQEVAAGVVVGVGVCFLF